VIEGIFSNKSGMLVDEIEANTRADIVIIIKLGEENSCGYIVQRNQQDWRMLFKKYGVK